MKYETPLVDSIESAMKSTKRAENKLVFILLELIPKESAIKLIKRTMSKIVYNSVCIKHKQFVNKLWNVYISWRSLMYVTPPFFR